MGSYLTGGYGRLSFSLPRDPARGAKGAGIRRPAPTPLPVAVSHGSAAGDRDFLYEHDARSLAALAAVVTHRPRSRWVRLCEWLGVA